MLTASARQALERAFVATQYMLGRRGEELAQGLPVPCPSAVSLAASLSNPDRPARAHALAGELGALQRALDARRIR
jgi:hypothetical protein